MSTQSRIAAISSAENADGVGKDQSSTLRSFKAFATTSTSISATADRLSFSFSGVTTKPSQKLGERSVTAIGGVEVEVRLVDGHARATRLGKRWCRDARGEIRIGHLLSRYRAGSEKHESRGSRSPPVGNAGYHWMIR